MHKVDFQPIPINRDEISSKITTTDAQMDKFVDLSAHDQKKIANAFARGILCQCLGTNKVFKVEPFRKLLADSMKITLPSGTLMPVLCEVNEYLMEVFGYAIAPINYGSRITIRESSSGIKELVLININNNPITTEANFSQYSPEEQGKLFWTVCFLYLCNGSEADKLKDHLVSITGDSLSAVSAYLDKWEKQRYLSVIKQKTNEGDISRYEVGLRAFHEIGYKNITKFVTQIEGIEYTDEIVNKWLDDTIGAVPEKKEKTVTKAPPTRRGRKKEIVEEEEDETVFEE